MAMDRILDRLAAGQPPLRVGEMAEFAGYNPETLRKILREGAIESVVLPGTTERRVPVEVARQVLKDLRVLRD